MTVEGTQAAAYRAAERRRRRAHVAALNALAGDPAAVRDLEQDWLPLVDGLRDLARHED